VSHCAWPRLFNCSRVPQVQYSPVHSLPCGCGELRYAGFSSLCGESQLWRERAWLCQPQCPDATLRPCVVLGCSDKGPLRLPGICLLLFCSRSPWVTWSTCGDQPTCFPLLSPPPRVLRSGWTRRYSQHVPCVTVPAAFTYVFSSVSWNTGSGLVAWNS
jgi:hypothetical protein